MSGSGSEGPPASGRRTDGREGLGTPFLSCWQGRVSLFNIMGQPASSQPQPLVASVNIHSFIYSVIPCF